MFRYIMTIGVAMIAVLSSQAQIVVPAFSFKTLEDKVYTNENLDLNRPTMIMNYDPYCDHCNEQAEIIKAAAEKFVDKKVHFVFVTFIPEKDAINEFMNKHFAGTKLTYTFLLDADIKFENYFGYSDDAINIFLYKPGQKKAKYFGEEQTAETLLKYL
ncbi:MAG: redoxin family protein [Bacteroidota bacterium]